MTLEIAPAAPLLPVVPAVLAMALEQIGWEIRSVDLDLAKGRATIEMFRSDGRWLHLSTDDEGHAKIERFDRRVSFERCPGGSFSNVVRDHFLGRTRCAGGRAALRSLSDYLADNPAQGRAQLSKGATRDALRLLMGGPEKLETR